jgi:hypothetical protein
LSPGFLSGVGPLEQAGFQKLSHKGLVMSSRQPFPFTGQSCELKISFSLGEILSYSLLPISPRQCNAWLSPQQLLCCYTPTQAISAQRSALHTSRQRGNILSVYLATSLVQRGCNWLPDWAKICDFLPNSVLHSPGGLADSLNWKWISYRAMQASSRQRFCVYLCLSCPGLSKCLQQLSFCSSLCCVIVGEVATH